MDQSCHFWNPRKKKIKRKKIKEPKIEPEKDKMELVRPVTSALQNSVIPYFRK
jgi:hypothetical protein